MESGEAPLGVTVTLLLALVAINVNQTSFPGPAVSQVIIPSLVALVLDELKQILPEAGSATANALLQTSFEGV
ncbi:hypothetical protein FSS13T_25300 [Flavobacterium saliperosum S13]|uniref:Uncharacterized protein n=1 Tax=Flavobacterium saliperosum S13 TaxID=1341155 RepID=A0ABP2ZUI1_9FLAO|nr:hypothetical protein FSS13T_25300 [Flavobacterium saliperosum S13]